MKRHKNLLPLIASEDNLRLAYANTAAGKRRTWGYLEFQEYSQRNLALLRQELLAGAYQPAPPRVFMVYEPKPRQISAATFKDRIVQHALMNIIGPPLERTLLPYTFACRARLGTHAGVRHIQALLRKTGATHYLQTDFRAYFASIDRARLHAIIARTIGCRATLDLLARIIPPAGIGLPIGALTSQHGANLYASAIDRLIHFELQPLGWARYMDDIIVLGTDSAALRGCFERIQQVAHHDRGLAISRWRIAPVAAGIDFLGYRIWPHHKLLRKRSVTRAKQAIARHLASGDRAALHAFLGAWLGHARWADSHNLLAWLEHRHDCLDLKLT